MDYEMNEKEINDLLETLCKVHGEWIESTEDHKINRLEIGEKSGKWFGLVQIFNSRKDIHVIIWQKLWRQSYQIFVDEECVYQSATNQKGICIDGFWFHIVHQIASITHRNGLNFNFDRKEDKDSNDGK